MRTRQLPEKEPHFLTRRELAERWRVSIETLKRRERTGKLPSLRLGREARYRMADVLRLEMEGEVLR
jgi:hypothetical protein